MDNGTRGELLDRLAEAIESVSTAHPLRVAVDGPPAAGKTTLADELALLVRTRGREVIRASIESFLLPGHSAIGAARTRPKAATTTPSTSTRSTGCCSIRSARTAIDATRTRSPTAGRTLRCPYW
jgi:putative protein kinase ArgK-like GTPase of G3E family